MKLGFCIDPHLTQRTPSSRVDDYGTTMLTKLQACEKIFFEEDVDYVYVTGDMFNSGDISFEYFNKVTEVFRSFRMPVASIVGNHTGDMRYDRIDTLSETPLGALFNTKTVQHLQHDLLRLDDERRVNVWGLDYKCELPRPIAGDINILVAHHGYGDMWGEKGIDDAALTGFNIAVLGHDHAHYPITGTGTGCVVIRPGSISRGTAGDEDRSRVPQVAILDLDAGTAKYIVVPHAPAEEVFSQQAVQHNEMKGEVRDYVKSLSECASTSTESVATLVKEIEDTDVRGRTIEHLTREGIL